MPRYTLTRPSPETAEPIRDLEERSTVNFKELDQAMAMLPSIFTSSSCRLNSISSSRGTGLSRMAIPLPLRQRLKSPSFPATAEDSVDLATTFCLIPESQARNKPSSNTRLPHSDTSSRRMYL